MRARSVVGALLVVAACASHPPPLTGNCSVVDRIDGPADRDRLPELYARHRQTLVVAGTLVLVCGCGERGLAGGEEGRRLAGGTEDRGLRGGTQDRDLRGGAEGRGLAGGSEGRGLRGGTQDRDLRGGAEGRGLAGGSEGRGLRGGTQDRDLGGGAGGLQCVEEPGCNGYQVSGSRDVSYFDGSSLRPSPSGCVPW